MGVPATALRLTQVGAETTRGSPVTPNKIFAVLSVSPGEGRTGYEQIQQMGSLAPVDVAPGYRWLEGEIEGPISVPDALYIIASAFGAPTPDSIEDSGNPTGAYRWHWTVSGSQPITPKTLTVETGQAGVLAFRMAGCQATDLEFTLNTEETELSGTLLGIAPEPLSTLSSGATRLPRAVIDPRLVKVYTAATLAGLDTATALGRVREVAISYGEQVAPAAFLGAPSVELVPQMDETEFTLRLAADNEARARFNEYANGDRIYFRVVAQGPVIYQAGSTVIRHSLAITLPVKWTEPSEMADDDDGIWVLEFTGAIIEDADLGGFTEIELVTSISTL